MSPSATLAIGHSQTVALFGEGSAHPADNHSVIIEWEVDDVDAEFARLDGVVTEWVQTPTTVPWGKPLGAAARSRRKPGQPLRARDRRSQATIRRPLTRRRPHRASPTAVEARRDLRCGELPAPQHTPPFRCSTAISPPRGWPAGHDDFHESPATSPGCRPAAGLLALSPARSKAVPPDWWPGPRRTGSDGSRRRGRAATSDYQARTRPGTIRIADENTAMNASGVPHGPLRIRLSYFAT